jgi:hypothetical protein
LSSTSTSIRGRLVDKLPRDYWRRSYAGGKGAKENLRSSLLFYEFTGGHTVRLAKKDGLFLRSHWRGRKEI